MTPDPAAPAELMVRAVQASLSHVEAGGLPFVGVVTGPGYASEPGVNLVARTGDPYAHAEIVAMRQALRDDNRADLAGMTLLATGEPCGLCYRFALDHHVDRIRVAVDAEKVAELGFDYLQSYPMFGIDRAALNDLVTPLPVTGSLEPFTRYLELHRPPGRSD